MKIKLSLSINKLYYHFSTRRQRQFLALLLLMIIASVAEVVSIGATLPFLGVLTAPEKVFNLPLMQPLVQMLNITQPKELIFPITIVFVSAAIGAGIIRLTLLYVMTRISFSAGADLSIDIYRRTLYQDYAVHATRNSSEVINGIIIKTTTVIHYVLVPLFTLVSSLFLLVGVMALLLMIDPIVALSAFIGFGLLYFGIIRSTRNYLEHNSQTVSKESTVMVKTLQEGLGGIRDVLLDNAQQFYCELYRNADLPLRRAQGNSMFIGQSPRFVMEAISIVLIAVLAYFLFQRPGGMTDAIPLLGTLALGAQRLLPVLQQAYSSFTNIKSSESSLEDVLNLLDQPIASHKRQKTPLAPISFEKEIRLSDLGFRYAFDSQWIIKNFNFTIKKGARVGFVGTTGSGKSTLLDVVMGLLSPTEGEILIDNTPISDNNRQNWQAHIAHVPQSIYLSDGTIEQNIAFGLPQDKIDSTFVTQVIEQVQLSDFISTLPAQAKTIVGERGMRLSGGQRQRIGIARALYKQANVLIFDEATSALDNQTEAQIMHVIESLPGNITVLIIAHRLSTLEGCDEVVDLS
jgi:ATP-binding cassette, subfamily B, bacterial PglK